ncbi:hypothetical protein BJ165DRAFT_728692 [Panaeolus papilionaceus]|nr:hypothetical protein BJ165DRAFT_728692 [Panaeolus papilionaceus]
MLEQPTLQTLLTDNKSPSDSIIEGVKRSLRDAEVELARIEEQIQALQQRAEDIKPAITQYRIILSPTRAVPDDILREIFNTTMQLNSDDAITSRRECNTPPVLFTHVCRRWREVAHSTPLLWRKHSIILPALVRLGNLGVRTSLLNDAISRQCSSLNQEAVRLQQWLKRAGALPLRLSVYQDLLSSPGTWHDERQDLHSELAKNLTWIFELISNYLPQCEHLHISLPDEHIYQLLSAHITPDTIARISYFRPNMNLRSSDVSQQHALKEMLLFTSLPALRRLHISHSITFLIPAEASSWIFTAEMRQRLTHITAEGSIALSQAVLILEDCPCLVQLQLHIQESSSWGSHTETTGQRVQPDAHIKEILALHLQVLKVDFYPNARHTVTEG